MSQHGDAPQNAPGDHGVVAFDLRPHEDTDQTIRLLQDWLLTQIDSEKPPHITLQSDGIANGMSSSTMLLDLDWNHAGRIRHESFAVRIAPNENDIRVFETYDLAAQFETMRMVAAHSRVPVPELAWLEPTGAVLGHAFFFMKRVSGQVPPDMLPYTFGDNWLFDATDAQRSTLEAAMIDVLVDLHAIADAPQLFSFLDRPVDSYAATPGSSALERHFQQTRAWYDWSVADRGVRSSLVEAALEKLARTIPGPSSETVLSWGDARIGNVFFNEFEPIAILDWEMAALGPRELDVAWLCYSHRVFQDLAVGFGSAGLPTFLRIADVVDTYVARSGHEIVALDWHLLYAAVRWACAFLRTGAREAQLNETPLPANGDSLLHNRASLAALVDGSFDA